MNFSVIIPSKSDTNLQACVGAIRAAGETATIMVVDDGLKSLPATCERVYGLRPFVFARNINIGISHVPLDCDVILCNDDALLMTPGGFTALAACAAAHPEYGVIASCTNLAGNPRQAVQGRGGGLRYEGDTLAFICVYIRRAVLDQVGPLDDRFTTYGWEDNDYCRRVKEAGLKLGIFDGCFVDHATLKSTFRGEQQPDLRPGREIYEHKWNGGGPPQNPTWLRFRLLGPTAIERRVDILYPAWNRLEFTRVTFRCLLAHTDWRHVRALYVYDDGSTDGTAEWLRGALSAVPSGVETIFRQTSYRSPVKVMQAWIDESRAPILAKLDNDTVFPPQWINNALDVMDRNPKLMMLGLEATRPCNVGPPPYSFEEAQFISGVGLYRRAAFREPMRPWSRDGEPAYYGLEDYQTMRPGLTRGWIDPCIPTVLLDRMPPGVGPWRELSDRYIAEKWQRPWENYTVAEHHALWDWWADVDGVAFGLAK